MGLVRWPVESRRADEGLGSYDGMSETMQQLDELLVTLGASAARS